MLEDCEMTRAEMEEKVKTFASSAIFVNIVPNINTHLGNISMLDANASCIENVLGDWVIVGNLSDLTDEEFDKVFHSTREYAKFLFKYYNK